MDRGPITRRSFLLDALAASALMMGAGARAQPAGKVFRIGVLANHVPRAELEMGARSPFAGVAAFVAALREYGWEDGKTVRIVWRSAEGRMDRHPGLASELARVPVDVIVGGDDAIRAAMQATRTIPVVAYSVYNPVESGYAKSLAKPGGNLTGILAAPPDGSHLQKALELLRHLSTRIRNVALVAHATERADFYPSVRPGSAMDLAAKKLGMELFFLTFGDAVTLPDLVRSAKRQGAHALLVDSNYAIIQHREIGEALAAQAARLRLPVMHLSLEAAANGGLMAVGVGPTKRWPRAAYFVDRILRGERPGDIPIETHPSNVEFHVNRKAARATGLEIPPTVLLQADRVFD